MKKNNSVSVKNSTELGALFKLPYADVVEMDFRSELTVALSQIIKNGEMTHQEIANKSGTARTRVTAIANGNTQGISTDVLIRVLAATGHRLYLQIY